MFKINRLQSSKRAFFAKCQNNTYKNHLFTKNERTEGFELFGLEISTALIDQTIKQTARSVEPMQDELVAQIEQAVLAHADESSWSEGSNHLWLWVLCTSSTVLYWIDKRTKEVFDNVLSLAFTGILMTDGYQTYRCRPNRLRCWAHLLRKLCGVAESTDRSAARHGQAMLGLFKDLMQAVFNAKEVTSQ